MDVFSHVYPCLPSLPCGSHGVRRQDVNNALVGNDKSEFYKELRKAVPRRSLASGGFWEVRFHSGSVFDTDSTSPKSSEFSATSSLCLQVNYRNPVAKRKGLLMDSTEAFQQNLLQRVSLTRLDLRIAVSSLHATPGKRKKTANPELEGSKWTAHGKQSTIKTSFGLQLEK